VVLAGKRKQEWNRIVIVVKNLNLGSKRVVLFLPKFLNSFIVDYCGISKL